MEAHYEDTAWTLAAHAVYSGGRRKAYYLFGESTGRGNATCPLQSPQQPDLQDWRYTAHYNVTPSAPESQRALSTKEEPAEEKKLRLSVNMNLGDWRSWSQPDIYFKSLLFFSLAVGSLAGPDIGHCIDKAK